MASVYNLVNLALFSNSGRSRNFFFLCFITLLLTFNLFLVFPGYRACAQELLSATFDTDSSGFTYQDDTFRSTSNPGYASGNYDSSGGFSGGGLHVALGGVDTAWKYGMSGGWTQTFVVNGDDTVNVTLWYRLVFLGDYEPDECGQALVAIDGQLLSPGSEDYLEEFCGFGDGSPTQDSGWQQVTLEVTLTDGTHTITVGGWNSKKTYTNEVTDVFFDEIVVTQQGQPPSSETNCIDGLDNDGDGFIDCLDSDCNGISGCEFGSEATCDDGIDNDGDGLTDCSDTDCIGAPSCSPETVCDDGIDNDGDGFIDCLDSDCNGVSGCEFGSEATCDDGIDNDGDGFTDCADNDCGTDPNCMETICNDGLDNDGDGLTDCDDPDCFGVGGCGTTILSATFDTDSSGFTYQDDTFRSTSNPGYASGNYDSSGGFSGGGLHVALGGVDTAWKYGMSGGWTQTFVVNGDDTVNVTLWYRLVFLGDYEPDECGQALVAIDGQLLSPGSEDYLEEFCGFGDGSPTQDSGWQQVTLEVTLTDGTHTITVGGWNSKKTYTNEVTDVFFDEIVVTQQGQPPSSETNCIDGLDNDGDGFIDCLDSDCNGVSGCEFGSEATCDDGIDNDGDGLTDCSDTDCIGAPSCSPETVCDDGLDNDGDGLTDCDDPDCFGVGGCGTTILSATFDTDSSGFTYQDDTFRSTSNPGYASGNYDSSGGFSGGGLHVALGGVDTAWKYGMSGGWTQTFVVNGDDTVNVTLWYRLVFLGDYEPDECGQALVAIDGQLLSPGSEDYLEEFCGFGDGSPTQDSGWQQVTLEVTLTDGTHTITVGGWNSKKTYTNEVTDVFFDEIVVTQQGQPPSSETNCIDGLDNDGDGFIDCLDSDCNGISGCEFGSEATCDDGIDNDGDGLTDCSDTDCIGAPSCSPETVCDDGIDNDGDGFIDCLDSDCNGVSGCEFGSEATCDDGIDNDGDGFTDCADNDCGTDPNCMETICNDGLDNDGDGLTDCDDPDCFGVGGCGTTILSATFDTDSSGFTYQDDTFRSTSNPGYASGNYDSSGGFSGGGLHVALGGVDTAWKYGMSGGWTQTFVVNGDDTVNVTLWYRLVFLGDYEPDECGQALVAIDGQLLSPGSEDYLEEFCGFGDGSPTQDSGWQQVTLEVTLTDGTHTITVGGWNSKKTYTNEVTDVFFDEIVVTQQGQPPSSETNCIDGLDNDGDGFIDCLDSDCNGVSGCEFGSEATCDDGIDNDGDGLTDCSDTDCIGAPSCSPETVCDDGLDNDGDGLTDCDDPDCFGVGGCGTTILSATFDTDSSGFTYQDDTFRSTSNPGYASGNYDSSGGFSGGGLHVALGGVDTAWKYGMSGGWTQTFVVNGDDTVNVTLWYRLVFLGDYEPDECGQALVAIDGQLLSPGSEDYLEEFCGFGDGSPTQDSGWQQVTLEVTLTDGTHTITVGGWNNKKTFSNEVTDVFFDEIVIAQTNNPNIIFFDDFTDGNPDKWTVVDDAGKSSDWQVVGGKYTQLNDFVYAWQFSNHLGSYSYYNNGMGLSDYQVKLNIRPLADVSGGRDSTGIMVRYIDENNYIRFLMSRMQGFLRLERKLNGNFTTLGYSGRGPNLGEENEVIIDVRCGETDCTDGLNNDGDTLTDEFKILVHYNGEPLFSAEDSGPTSGTIALFTQSFVEFDNVLISNPSETPRIVVQQPTSYSVAVNDSGLEPYELQVSAQAINVPLNYGVKFAIDSGTPNEFIDYSNTFSGTFSNVPQGDRMVTAVIVDQNGDPLYDPMGQDQDMNIGVGVGGKYFVAMGDSITNGYGDDRTDDNDALNGKILSRGYTPILTNLLSSLLTPPISVCIVNEGLGGTTSKHGRDRLTETLNRYPESQIWLILFGTNDSSGAFPILSGIACQEPENFDPDDPNFDSDCLHAFKGYMRTIILDLKAQNKIPALAYVPYRINASPSQDNLINEYNQVIYDLWQFHNLPVAPPDFYQHFSDPANQDKFYDSTHPNGDGYIDIANMWYVELVNSGILN